MYNKLLDTRFENNIWKFNNCYYKDGYLISSNNIFGIEQEITLYELNKLYARFEFNVDNFAVKKATIGIQANKVLYGDFKKCKVKSWQSISVVHKPTTNKVKIHLIFESENKINKVYVKNPILVDIDKPNKSHVLKFMLDKYIYFKHGYTYSNLYNVSEILPESPDFVDYNLEKAKYGSIIKTLEDISIKIDTSELKLGRYYLAKLSFTEVNDIGSICFRYNKTFSTKINNQIYIMFKKSNDDLFLDIKANNILEYIVNIKNLLLIDLSSINLLEEDIPYLTYV